MNVERRHSLGELLDCILIIIKKGTAIVNMEADITVATVL